MKRFSVILLIGFGALSGCMQASYYGDNTSEWARDGECDDPRFKGKGMAETLLAEDQGHDADDCKMLENAGRITRR